MKSRVDYVQGDLLPILDETLIVSGVAVNLTGCTVRLVIRHSISGVELFDRPVTILSPSAGTVRYEPEDGDTDIPGSYQAHWLVTDGDGRRRTLPTTFVVWTVHPSADHEAGTGPPPPLDEPVQDGGALVLPLALDGGGKRLVDEGSGVLTLTIATTGNIEGSTRFIHIPAGQRSDLLFDLPSGAPPVQGTTPAMSNDIFLHVRWIFGRPFVTVIDGG